MIINIFEQLLMQFCFILFFLVTLTSWMKIFVYQNTQPTIPLSLPVEKKTKSETYLGLLFGFFAITCLCLIRWAVADHLPLSNLYESSLFLSWILLFLYCYLKTKIEDDWLDAVIAPILLFTTTFTNLGLPKEFQESTALVPALQSNWLMMHVSMMILSYGALLLGSLLSLTFLIIKFNFFLSGPIAKISQNVANNTSHIKSKKVINEQKQEFRFNQTFPLQSSKNKKYKKENNIKNYLFKSQTEEFFLYFVTKIYLQKNKMVLKNQLDYWSYRMIGIGFPFLTLGILSGAVWANESWGSYWNWDPKETWALITWFIFAIYLHVRITKEWSGTKPAVVASLGFFVIWMCYLGVNLLGKGLHSYGWLT